MRDGCWLQEETKKRGTSKNAGQAINVLKMDSLQKAQDPHAALDHMLAGLMKLQKEGLDKG